MALTPGTRQIIYGGLPNAAPSTTALNYATIHSQNSSESWTATANFRRTVFATSGKIRNVKFSLSTPPGAGATYQMSIVRNNATVGYFVNISDSATTGEIVGDLDVAAGDDIAIRCSPIVGSEPASTFIMWSMEYETSEANVFELNGSTGNAPLTDGTTEFNNPSGGGDWNATAHSISPLAFTITDFRIKMSSSPGAGTSWTFHIYVGGVEVSASEIVVADTSTSGSVSGLSISIPAASTGSSLIDGRFSIAITGTGTPGNSSLWTWGMRCVTADPYQSIVAGATTNTFTTDGNFNRIKTSGSFFGDTATEANIQRYSYGPRHTLSNFVFSLYSLTGTESKTFTLRQNGNDTDLNPSAASGGVRGNIDTATVTIESEDLLSVKYNQSGSSNDTGAIWAFLQSVPPMVYDEIAITEDVTVRSFLSFSQTETVSISESVTIVVAFDREVSDSISIAENVARTQAFNNSSTESISVAENTTTLVMMFLSLQDDISISEDIIRDFDQDADVSVFDTVTIVDSLSDPEKAVLLEVSDLFIVSDEITRSSERSSAQLPIDRARGQVILIDGRYGGSSFLI